VTDELRPIGLLAELTHRCPLGCPYCSNPLELTRSGQELDTKNWIRVFNEAADMGIMHVHLSGGEPLVRKDIAELTNAAHLAGLYTNLITSGVGLNAQSLTELRAAGLEHVFLAAAKIVEDARKRLEGSLVIDHVMPDYYAERPKACMGGWGRQVLVVTPDGRALPCHAAATLPGLTFDNVRDRSLADIWESSDAFNKFRGTAWMPKPCKGCERAEIDWGGCRCQAFAITGEAATTDPACGLSPQHAKMRDMATTDAASTSTPYRFRRIGG
jgi:radical SAM protein with 4Fe4S-binding SPASM domain